MENRVLLGDGAGGRAPEALRSFLVRDPVLQAAGRVRWEPARPARPGELGTGLDVLTLVVSGMLALPSAIDTVRRWCASPGGSDAGVTMSVGEVTVTVRGDSTAEEVAAMAAALRAALESDIAD